MNESTPLLNTQSARKKPSPWYIIIPLFCLTFSFSALYAPMVQFYTVIFCYKYYQTNDIGGDIPLENCAIPEVQALASEAQAIIMFLTYTSTLLFASFYGSLSDRKGRRRVLMISTFGNMLLVTCYVLTLHFPQVFGITLLFISPILRGAFAGDTVLLAAAQAYISDCTTPSSRTVAFGHMLSSLFIGATLGPSVGSLLIRQTNSILSIFYLTLTINSLFICYVYFVLPESNDFTITSKQQEEPQTFLQRINVFSALSILAKASSTHANRYALPIIAGIQFCLNIISLPPTLLYAMLKFHWSAYEGGFYISMVGFARLLTTMLVLPLISKLFHHFTSKQQQKEEMDSDTSSMCKFETLENLIDEPSTSEIRIEEDTRSESDIKAAVVLDSWLIRFGLTFETCSFIAIGLVTTSSGFTIASIVHSLSFLSTPSVRSLLTTLVNPSDVGKLLGAVAVLESVAMIISQLSINTIYSASVGTMPNLVFFVCSMVAGLALTLSFFVYPSKKL